MVVGFLFIPVGLFFLSFSASVSSPSAGNVVLYENTTAAVKDFPTFHVNKVFIHQSPETNKEALHTMTLFFARESCDNLPSNTKHLNTAVLSPPPNETKYLLKGSELSFNICAATDEKNHPGAFMNFYIVSDLSDIERSKQPESSHHYTIDIGYSENLPNETKPGTGWKCSEIIHYSVKKDGYYSTILYPSKLHPNRVKVWHEANNSYRMVDVSLVNQTVFRERAGSRD